MEKESLLDQKFYDTQLENEKLEIALERFFGMDPMGNEIKEQYRLYLQRRIRPAVQLLIEREDMQVLRRMEGLGWLKNTMLDTFITFAKESQKVQAVVYFMKLKESCSFFEDRDFHL